MESNSKCTQYHEQIARTIAVKSSDIQANLHLQDTFKRWFVLKNLIYKQCLRNKK